MTLENNDRTEDYQVPKAV